MRELLHEMVALPSSKFLRRRNCFAFAKHVLRSG
jgi:hypothetical protein